MGWQNGRQLASASSGSNTPSYTYDANGLRASKTVNGTKHTYVYNGSQLILESYGTTRLEFLYDAGGAPYAVRHSTNSGSSWTTYYYILNLQGDVVALMNTSGSIVAKYTYDAWGKVTAVTNGSGTAITDSVNIANANPIRYRGYYYDTESLLYYLQSRYYDPEVGRFLNADGYVSTGQGIMGTNMYAYCGNNPVNRVDSTGQSWDRICEFVKTAIAEIGKAIGVMSPAYAGCGGAAAVDGPLPFGDVVAIAGAALLTVGAIGIGINQAVQASAVSTPKAEEKTEAKATLKEPYSPVIFPANPNDFNPLGLVKVPRAGTKNGSFISWMDPFTNTEVFRWDENPNFSNGPHYHIYGSGHYTPGVDIVPEPYASIYFPFR